ncbi:MAG: hypothetical protein P4N59_17370 [Negativicutes bacterium]|nr:hypothetical protein [Negativicutes bacterium]
MNGWLLIISVLSFSVIAVFAYSAQKSPRRRMFKDLEYTPIKSLRKRLP